MAYRIVGVIVEKVPPKLGCGGLLAIVFILWVIGKSGSSASQDSSPPRMEDPSTLAGPSAPRLGDRELIDPTPPRANLSSPDPAGRSALGIGIGDIDQLDATKRAALGIIDDSGVLVTSVTPGGAADRAGMRPGDVILAFNGSAARTTSDLRALAGGAGIGSNATVRVRRAAKVLNLSATLQAAASRADLTPPRALTPPSPTVEDDKTDAAHLVLAPDDDGFVDTRSGWGWSDRCLLNIKAGKLGWAKAECLKGMALGPASPNPRASLLYNLGLIEQKSGNSENARQYFERSLALREHPEVRAALDSLR